MAFRMGITPLVSRAQERDAEVEFYRNHVRELRHILSARDEGLLSENEMKARMLAVMMRALGESR
jgi:hypothetical protein